MTAANPSPPFANSMRHAARNCVRCLLVFLALAVLGLIVGSIGSGMHNLAIQLTGFIFSAVCAFGIFITLLILPGYRKQAKQMDEILSGTELLGRWSCTNEEWERHIQSEKKKGKKDFKLVLGIIGISMVILLGVMIFSSRQDPMSLSLWLVVGAIFLGVGILIGGIGWLAATLPERRLRKASNHDICVGSSGLYLGGKFISWHLFFAKLEGVKYDPGDPGTIQFSWLQPGAGYYGTAAMQAVRAPVPKTQDALAREIVHKFSNQFKGPV
jgi:hypothetical protein